MGLESILDPDLDLPVLFIVVKGIDLFVNCRVILVIFLVISLIGNEQLRFFAFHQFQNLCLNFLEIVGHNLFVNLAFEILLKPWEILGLRLDDLVEGSVHQNKLSLKEC